MTLTSPWYLLFLACVVVLTPRVRSTDGRQILILAASWIFYASFGIAFLPILWLSIAFGWWTLQQIGRSAGSARRMWLTASVVGSLLVLASFKYGPDLARLANHILSPLGFELDPSRFKFRFPLGISFYVFESISCAVDVYRGTTQVPRRARSYATFISFFPHLLAGPIVRANRLIPQLDALPQRATDAQFARGLELLVTGLFRKLVLGDQILALAATIPTAVNSHYRIDLHALTLFLTLAGVYCDFAGYTDLARGSAKLLGVELPANFRQPLTRSRSVADFWTRYNSTMMAWFRDYVYLPLRTRLGGRSRGWLALIVLFVLSGIWHQAALRWVLWGAVLGASIGLERTWRRRAQQRHGQRAQFFRQPLWTRFLRPLAVDATMITIFVAVTASNAWIDPPTAAARAAGSTPGPAIIPSVIAIVALLGGMVWFDAVEPGFERADGQVRYTRPRTLGIATMVVAIAIFGGVARAFTYFSL